MAAPWILGFSNDHAAMACSLVAGAVLASCSISALGGFFRLFGEVDVALGVLIAVAPWLLGFGRDHRAAWALVVLGLLAALVSAMELRQLGRLPPQTRN